MVAVLVVGAELTSMVDRRLIPIHQVYEERSRLHLAAKVAVREAWCAQCLSQDGRSVPPLRGGTDRSGALNNNARLEGRKKRGPPTPADPRIGWNESKPDDQRR